MVFATSVPAVRPLYPDTFRVTDPGRVIRQFGADTFPIVEASRYTTTGVHRPEVVYSLTWQTGLKGRDLSPRLDRLREMSAWDAWCTYYSRGLQRDDVDTRPDGTGYSGNRLMNWRILEPLLNDPGDLHAITVTRMFANDTSLPDHGESYELLPSKIRVGTWDIRVLIPEGHLDKIAEVAAFIGETTLPDLPRRLFRKAAQAEFPVRAVDIALEFVR